MKTLHGVYTLTAALIATSLLLGSSQEVVAAPTGIKNVVLVHGAFADGSGWKAVANILEKDGVHTRQGHDDRSEVQSCGLHLTSEGNSQAHRRGGHLRKRQS
jgi:hypothetical protein